MKFVHFYYIKYKERKKKNVSKKERRERERKKTTLHVNLMCFCILSSKFFSISTNNANSVLSKTSLNVWFNSDDNRMLYFIMLVQIEFKTPKCCTFEKILFVEKMFFFVFLFISFSNLQK